MAERPKVVVVQCVCGKLKQQGFICDYCYSTEGDEFKPLRACNITPPESGSEVQRYDGNESG